MLLMWRQLNRHLFQLVIRLIDPLYKSKWVYRVSVSTSLKIVVIILTVNHKRALAEVAIIIISETATSGLNESFCASSR